MAVDEWHRNPQPTENNPMSHISKLKLTQQTPISSGNLPPKERARTKAIQYLEQQRLLIQGHLGGEPYLAYRNVYRTLPDGNRVRVQEPAHVRRGWWLDAAGTTFFQIRYGSKPVMLDKTSTAIEVGALAGLPAIIDTLLAAVRAGELDTALVAASQERKKNFAKRKATTKGG
jgi:hypothetical protein